MNPYPCGYCERPVSRRDLLKQLGAGFGSLALAGLLAEECAASDLRDPLAPKRPHFAPRAKRVIMLFMDGGPSQHDLFDYKPRLERDHGKPLPTKLPRVLSNADRLGNLRGPLQPFKQCGESGIWMSEALPHLAEVADALCMINSMHCSNPQHGAALLEWHTGSDTFVRPSMGSWLLYGLGTENQNLPGYITISQSLGMAGSDQYGSAFLPAVYQGTPFGQGNTSAEKASFPFVSNPKTDPVRQRLELDFIREMGEEYLQKYGPNSDIEARIHSFELAFRMQTEAPAAQDISDESAATLRLYGLEDKATANMGRQCLLARRFVERGVRFVQCNLTGWDHHDNLSKNLPSKARQMDKPIAGLIQDLRSRGLLQDTLVVWGGEFGRNPMSEGTDGRDHNPYGYTMWLAGAGVKRGMTYGRTDDYGFYAIEDKMHVHDLHATILHLLGIDHQRLTYRYAGRDFRLTDVHGHVAQAIIA
jgi:hypothetical protein